jgi:hypothetical protein
MQRVIAAVPKLGIIVIADARGAGRRFRRWRQRRS